MNDTSGGHDSDSGSNGDCQIDRNDYAADTARQRPAADTLDTVESTRLLSIPHSQKPSENATIEGEKASMSNDEQQYRDDGEGWVTVGEVGRSVSTETVGVVSVDTTPSVSRSATAVTYVRVSTDKQAGKGGGEGFSIPAQREACRRKAEALGADVVAEYVDAGESARSVDRPQLAEMLEWISRNRPDFVIVHKVDRLARNRADDVAITLAIRQTGAALVSCTENIDETPSGKLMHGIMSLIAEFYSANLATEVKKGNLEKIKRGGTIGKAPIGYLNVREIFDGREIRTVAVDEERAPLIRLAYERYTQGDISLRDLLDDLTDRGLRSVAGPKTPSKPLSLSQFQRIMRSPYYKGMVIYKGAAYPGNHQALVSEELWDQVQARLTARNYAGEKKRKHHHYLKGTVFCGTCGARLLVTNAKSRHGTIYPYFVCAARHKKRNDCTQKAMRIAWVEERVEEHYAKIQPKPEFLVALQAMVEEELDTQALVMERQHQAQQRRKADLVKQRAKLLEAHYADAIPVELLKEEQTRIAAEIAKADELIAANTLRHEQVLANLRAAVAEAENWNQSYMTAGADTRREINQSVFTKIYVSTDRPTRADFAEPFEALLHTEMVVATAERELHHGRRPNWVDCQIKRVFEKARGFEWPEIARKTQTLPERQGLTIGHLVPLVIAYSNPSLRQWLVASFPE